MKVENGSIIIRILKLPFWKLFCFFREIIVSKILRAADSNTLIKLISNPFKYAKLKILNPYTWFKILMNKDKNFPDIKNFEIPFIPVNSHIYFYIDRILKQNPNIKRIGLVFFMGIGDYFYSTTFIEYFKSLYHNLPFDAYVSKNMDKHNSPIVGKCIEVNPFFENVYYYDGYLTESWWKNYDYSDCYRSLDKDTLLLPMIYEYNILIKSRFEALCRTFTLPVKKLTPPKVYTDYPCTENTQALYDKLKNRFCYRKHKSVVFVQMSSRSSNYVYHYTDELIKDLLSDGYFVLTTENTKIKGENCIKINVNKITINETIKLISLIKSDYALYFLCITSLFSSISSGLNIKALILHHFYDKAIKSIWFPNVYVITDRDYFQLPRKNVFIAKRKNYEINQEMRTYAPKFILSCFNKMVTQ